MLLAGSYLIPISMWRGRLTHSDNRVSLTCVVGAYHSPVLHSCSESSKHRQAIQLQSLLFQVVHDLMEGNRRRMEAVATRWTLEQHLMQSHRRDVSRCHCDRLPAVAPAAGAGHHLSHMTTTGLKNTSVNILIQSIIPLIAD